MENKRMIRFEKVTKSFNGNTILSGLSFEINPNEKVGIVGTSGIGKTTLLRLISGALKPDSGKIDVKSPHIGIIFQEPRLLSWRTALQNISLVLQAKGIEKKSADESARRWIVKLGLGGFERYYPGQLSGGMQQKVSIARALCIEPQILLMDEPFSHLDAVQKDSLMAMVEDLLKDYRTTVVYVTHDLLEALRLSDRIFHLSSPGEMLELDLSDRRKLAGDYVNSRLKSSLGGS